SRRGESGCSESGRRQPRLGQSSSDGRELHNHKRRKYERILHGTILPIGDATGGRTISDHSEQALFHAASCWVPASASAHKCYRSERYEPGVRNEPEPTGQSRCGQSWIANTDTESSPG